MDDLQAHEQTFNDMQDRGEAILRHASLGTPVFFLYTVVICILPF